MHIIEEEKKEYKYGGFWVRFVAIIIDAIVLFFVQSLFSFVFTGQLMSFYSEDGDNSAYWTSNLLSIFVSVGYYAGFESSAKQATIGKMCFDLKVVDTSGNRISFLRGVGRYFSKILSTITLMIGYIMAAFDSRKQALHDKLASTMVVYDK